MAIAPCALAWDAVTAAKAIAKQTRSFNRARILALLVKPADPWRSMADASLAQQPADGLQEMRHGDGLGDVGFAAAIAYALLVSLHGAGGDRDHRNGGQLRVFLEPE